jgi:hypothetical protein
LIERNPVDRVLWLCESDTDADSALARLYGELVAALKAADGRPYAGLAMGWSIYDRLRQLTVPLAPLEQVAASTWAGSLRDRIQHLKTIQAFGDVWWETTWPRILDAVDAAYETFLKREETTKFWSVASITQKALGASGRRVRIVTPSVKESELLLEALSHVIDGVDDAVAAGQLEILNASAEARLIAEGQVCDTILLGPRTRRHRHLDAFPSHRVDELVYPHEASIERITQGRLYEWWTSIAAAESRRRLLSAICVDVKSDWATPQQFKQPRLVFQTAEGHPVRLAREADVSQVLDIDSLIDSGTAGDDTSALTFAREHTPSGVSGDSIEVAFAQGEVARYSASQNVDVFFSETGVVQRYPAAALQRGWRLISFVDGRYDGLFSRLTDVVNARLPQKERVALELWQKAKTDLFDRYDNKTILYDKLRSQGLSSTYEAFMGWFDDEDGNLAPQQFGEFEVVAKECGIYNSPKLIRTTFDAVQHRRGRNRSCGRQLKQFLRAVVSGDGYNEALDSARKLDAALGDVLAAVELLEVASLRLVPRASDVKRESHLFS